jgi:hypothetical protein
VDFPEEVFFSDSLKFSLQTAYFEATHHFGIITDTQRLLLQLKITPFKEKVLCPLYKAGVHILIPLLSQTYPINKKKFLISNPPHCHAKWYLPTITIKTLYAILEKQ